MQPRFQGYMGAGRTDFWSGTQSSMGVGFRHDFDLTTGDYEVLGFYWKVEDSLQKLTPESGLKLNRLL